MSVHQSTPESELDEFSICSEQQRQLTDSVDSLLLQNSFRAAVRRTCYRCRCSPYRLRRVKSKGAILVLAISFLIFTTFNSVDSLLFSKLQFNVHFFPSLAHMMEHAIHTGRKASLHELTLGSLNMEDHLQLNRLKM